jgi:hypothetical protein
LAIEINGDVENAGRRGDLVEAHAGYLATRPNSASAVRSIAPYFASGVDHELSRFRA